MGRFVDAVRGSVSVCHKPRCVPNLVKFFLRYVLVTSGTKNPSTKGMHKCRKIYILVRHISTHTYADDIDLEECVARVRQ